ncbi:MAG: cbb3-type cytochrome c oxidase subunit II [Acidimicrobiia bacterium]
MSPKLIYLTGGSLLSLLLGVIVTIVIPAQDRVGPSPLARPYTDTELAGRAIYLREGCHYCHTQQVRAPEAYGGMVHQPGDLGPESDAGDYYYQSPAFWGTERQGPDLSHLASRPPIGSNAEWHILHLKKPRDMIPGSVMPSYDYLSDADLEALTAYLMTLR